MLTFTTHGIAIAAAAAAAGAGAGVGIGAWYTSGHSYMTASGLPESWSRTCPSPWIGSNGAQVLVAVALRPEASAGGTDACTTTELLPLHGQPSLCCVA